MNLQNNYGFSYNPYIRQNYNINNLPMFLKQDHSHTMPSQFTLPVQTKPTPKFVFPQTPVNSPIINNTAAQKYINKVSNKIYPKTVTTAPVVNPLDKPGNYTKTVWKNDLRSLFHNNNASIYAMVVRTFNAKDKNGNGLIDFNQGEQSGTFLNAISGLDELKSYGINTIHLLPIHPPGKKNAMGIAGSVYAPFDYLQIDPKLDDPNNPMNVYDETKKYADEAHKRGIRLMMDLPSCASVDMYEKLPNLMAKDAQGNPKVPQGWQDIRMFDPWQDKEKKILNKPLMDMHKKFVDMAIDLGMDGIRADVSRAKPVEFWNELINYARAKDPNFAFLAESYTYEDASPLANIPADRPEDALKAGFDSYYGQYHIFNQWKTAKDFHYNMALNLDMSNKLPPNKSLIGSFATHDDNSPMANGGVPYCNLTTGLQATLPMTNPYFVTGFESGDRYIYPYKDKMYPTTDTDNNKCIAHPEKLDIFNYSRKPGGKNPEIGEFMSKIFKLRSKYQDVITKGSYIPLKVQGNKNDQIIAYTRHLDGKTLLIIANKDVNSIQKGQVIVPTLKSSQSLVNLASNVGIESRYSAQNEAVKVDLGPAGFNVFEINTPDIEKNAEKVYRQNLTFDIKNSRKIPYTYGQEIMNMYRKFKSS